MNKEKPAPKDMYTLARIINDLQTKTFTDQEAIDVGGVVLRTAYLIDQCIFCTAIRHDFQPSFVNLIVRHFEDKHLVAEK